MKISSSAVKYPETILSVRTDYLIALVPTVLWCMYRFGINALRLMLISAVFALITEFFLKLLIYKKPSMPDAYTIYLGLIFSLTLFDDSSMIFAGIGGAISVLIYRFIGSKGQCFIFTPFASRLILTSIFPDMLNAPHNLAAEYLYDNSISSASTYEFILGTVSKSIGSVSALALVTGALYLLVRRNTNRIGTLSYVLTAFLLMFFFPLMEGRGMESAINEILAGEMIFVLAFVMTDFSWAPRSTLIKFISGALTALIAFILLRAKAYSDAYYLSVIISGFLSFILDNLFFNLKYNNYRKVKTINADE